MSKNSKLKPYFQSLRDKKEIQIDDIDNISKLFVDFFKLAHEQFKSSLEIRDRKQRIALQIIAVENLSKPIAISEIIPVPFEKWIVTDDDFKYHIIKASSDHEFKQKIMCQYGKVVGHLKYKYWIPEIDVNMLQKIKELYQHGDSEFPFSEKQAIRLSKKMENFLEERLNSLHMYHDEESAKIFVRKLSILRHFTFPSERQDFILSLTEEIKDFKELCLLAKKFKSNKNSMNVKMSAIITADEPEEFTKQLTDLIDKHIFQEQVYEARKMIVTKEYIKKHRLLKKIIKDSIKKESN